MASLTESERSGQGVETAYARLREAILHGDLRAGSVVVQARLAEVAGTSRTPVREALRLLEAEGLIVSEANKRIQIADFAPQDIEELEILRIAIESTAVRLTVPTLGADEIGRLEGLLAEMAHFQRLQDFDRFDAPHRRFHLALSTAMGPRTLKRISDLCDYDRRYRRAVAQSSGPQAEFESRQSEHRRILDLAAVGNADGCAEALTLHYAHAASYTLSQLDPGYVPARLNSLTNERAASAP
jgi:DNA-binding GntR family transcriptional regulator